MYKGSTNHAVLEVKEKYTVNNLELKHWHLPGKAILRNQIWFSMVYNLIHNNMCHHNGQNVVES